VALPELHVAVFEGRDLSIGIDGQEVRPLLLALGQIDADEVDGQVQILGNGTGPAGVWSLEVIKLHGALLGLWLRERLGRI
jgi:hypothetical protein